MMNETSAAPSLTPEQLSALARAMNRIIFVFTGFFGLIVAGNVFRGEVESATIGSGILVFWIILISAMFRPSYERGHLADSVWSILTDETTLRRTLALVLIPSFILAFLGAITINPSEQSNDFASLSFPIRIAISLAAFAAAGFMIRFAYLTFSIIPRVVDAQSTENSSDSSVENLISQLKEETARKDRELRAALDQLLEKENLIEKLQKNASHSKGDVDSKRLLQRIKRLEATIKNYQEQNVESNDRIAELEQMIASMEDSSNSRYASRFHALAASISALLSEESPDTEISPKERKRLKLLLIEELRASEQVGRTDRFTRLKRRFTKELHPDQSSYADTFARLNAKIDEISNAEGYVI